MLALYVSIDKRHTRRNDSLYHVANLGPSYEVVLCGIKVVSLGYVLLVITSRTRLGAGQLRAKVPKTGYMRLLMRPFFMIWQDTSSPLYTDESTKGRQTELVHDKFVAKS